MKTRSKRLVLFALTTALFLIVGGWWLTKPVGPELAPELAAHLIPANLVPPPGGYPPPPGTRWEIYSIPMPYSEVLEAMKRVPEWRVTEGVNPHLRLKKATLFPTSSRSPLRIEVQPGRVRFVEELQRAHSFGRSAGYSVIAIAVPEDGTLRRATMALVGRVLGRPSAPVASKRLIIFLRDDQYVVSPVAKHSTSVR